MAEGRWYSFKKQYSSTNALLHAVFNLAPIHALKLLLLGFRLLMFNLALNALFFGWIESLYIGLAPRPENGGCLLELTALARHSAMYCFVMTDPVILRAHWSIWGIQYFFTIWSVCRMLSKPYSKLLICRHPTSPPSNSQQQETLPVPIPMSRVPRQASASTLVSFLSRTQWACSLPSRISWRKQSLAI